MKKKIILCLKIYLFANIVALMVGGVIDIMSLVDGHMMPHDYITPVIAVNVVIVLVLSIAGLARLIFGKETFK